MSGTITSLGKLTIGAIVPAAALPIATVLGQLQAQYDGALALQVRLKANPPSLLANIEAVEKLLIALRAAVAIGLPYVDIQLSAVEVLIAQLFAKIQALLALQTALLVAGVGVYQYEGDAPSYGPAVSSVVPHAYGGSSVVFSLLLVADAAETITALKGVFVHV